jgi:serralysin
MNACHVQQPSNGGNTLWGITKSGSFVVIDGFELDGNASTFGGVAGACVRTDDPTFGTGNSAHHVWVLNNIIHDCNMSGVQLNNKEWFYVIHNKVYNNSFTSGHQGSGISIVVPRCIEGGNASCWQGSTYTPSGMDLNTYSPFHIVVAWNDVSGNSIDASNGVGCGNHTDGNGIIMDTFFDEATNTVAFPYQSLVMANVSYKNGGRGVHVFRASNVTAANNTTYGNGTDTCINAYVLGDLSQQGGTNNVWINNISQSVLTAANPSCGRYCGNRNAPILAGNAGDVIDKNITWSNNVTYGGIGVSLFDNDARVPYFSCNNNRCNTNPLLVNLASGNFALQSGSPAIAYGQAKTYIPPPPVDAGACSKAFTTCP